MKCPLRTRLPLHIPLLILLLFLCLLPTGALLAVDPPGILHHQGRIAVDGVNYDGTGYFKFVLGDVALTTSYWSNDSSSTAGSEPTAALAVTVTNGHYAVLLGDTNAIDPATFADNDAVYLAIWFSTDNTTFEKLSPDQRLTTAPYALSAAVAQTAQGVELNAITADMLADGAVTDSKIADNSVDLTKLQTSNSLSLRRFIPNPEPADGDRFGWSVAAVGTDKLLIGAYRDDTGATDAGSAYLFDRNGNLLQTINNPTPANNDEFGFSVAAVGTDKLLIGAYRDDTGATDAGSAYLFDLEGTLLQTINNPTPANIDWFGQSVAGVGTDKLLIGAYSDNTGAIGAGSAYLFDLEGTLLQTIHNPTPADLDFFGISVAAVGTDKLLIGANRDDTGANNAGSAYLFDLEGNLLQTIHNPDPASDDIFGWSVAAVGTDKLLIGAYWDDTGATNAGSAYLFDLEGNLLQTINHPDPASSDRFGQSVAAVGTDKLLIGAYFDDAGATDAGSAYLFDLDGTLLQTINNPDPAIDDRFGWSVAAVGTDKLLIGASGDDTGASSAGSAYLFDLGSSIPGLVGDGVVPDTISSDSIVDGSLTAADIDPSSIGLWSVSGGDVYRASGRVGIGTSDPSVNLDVNGTIQASANLLTDVSLFAKANVVVDSDSSNNGFLIFGSGSSGERITSQRGASPNNFGLDFLTASQVRMSIEQGGNVGIGTTDPEYKLDVAGDLNTSGKITAAGYVGIGTNDPDYPLHVVGSQIVSFPVANKGFNENSVLLTPFSFGGVSLRAEGSVWASLFVASSDERIKAIEGLSDSRSDLDAIAALQVTDYRMIDSVQAGSGRHKGFIAQEVAEILPAAVSRGVGFIPDIYASAQHITSVPGSGQTRIDLAVPHGLSGGETIRLYAGAEMSDVAVTGILSATALLIEGVYAWEEVFVYGREVDDFLSVNYDHVFTTAVSALQELKREKDAEVDALAAANAALHAETESLRTRLERVEALLEELADDGITP